MNQNLSGLESRQRCLKDELACVERLISDAVAEKTRLGCSIATRKALLGHSPVQALPTEVLSQIFLDYNALSQTAQENVFEEIVAYHRIHTPILSVCRRWRSTALADPRLWTTIPLIGSGGEDKSYSHPLLSESPEERATYWNALQSVIERTSALPLQLLLHTFIRLFPRANSLHMETPFLHRSPRLNAIMDDADIPHAGGVYTARVKVDDGVFRRKILSAIPNVEVLEVNSLDINQWFIDAPTAGHRLRSFQILHTISLEDVLSLLDRAPLLEELKVDHISITHSGGTLRDVIHRIFQCSTADSNLVFRYLTLPSLLSLSYVGDWAEKWPRPKSTTNGWRRALVHLQLNLSTDGEGELRGGPTRKSLLDLLSTGGPNRPLPALTVLWVGTSPQQLNMVEGLIHSRSAYQVERYRIATLREVNIVVFVTQKENDEIMKEEHAAMFKAFVNEGFDIRILYEH